MRAIELILTLEEIVKDETEASLSKARKQTLRISMYSLISKFMQGHNSNEDLLTFQSFLREKTTKSVKILNSHTGFKWLYNSDSDTSSFRNLLNQIKIKLALLKAHDQKISHSEYEMGDNIIINSREWIREFNLYINQECTPSLRSLLKEKRKQELEKILRKISTLLEKDEKEDTRALSAIQTLDQLLEKFIFKSRFQPKALKSEYLELFYDFLDLFNSIIPAIQIKNPALALSIKIKFSNLFSSAIEGEKYPNLFSTKREQCQIMIDRFKSKERQLTIKLTAFLKEKMLPITKEKEKEILNSFEEKKREKFWWEITYKISPAYRLAKIVSSESRLEDSNLKLLRAEFSELFPSLSEEKSRWEDLTTLREYLVKMIGIKDEGPDRDLVNLIDQLKRVAKAKYFFSQEIQKAEEEIRIPSWYHTTNEKGRKGISASMGILVRKDKFLEGVWLSLRRENLFGDYTFGFDRSIYTLDEKPAHNFNDDHVGLQTGLPLVPHLAVLGEPATCDESQDSYQDRKRDKEKCRKEHLFFGNPQRVMSVKQIEVMSESVCQTLGTPYRPESWK